jgi:hypothetical protein
LQKLRISPFGLDTDAEHFNVPPEQPHGTPEFSQLPFFCLYVPALFI